MKPRILIIEDKLIAALDMKSRLERKGYQVTRTDSRGEEVLAIIQAENPDLVLMDIRLGGENNGLDITQGIHHLLDVPIVYVTATADEQTLQRAKHGVPFGYILKPFDERELLTTIETSLSKYKMEQALGGALDRHEFRLVYQPIVHLGTGRVTSFEALLRWESPEFHNVPIVEVVTALETSGQILPVGNWVLSEACRQLCEWQLKYKPNPPLAVNVNISGKQLPIGFSVENIKSLLKSNGLEASQLKFEISEKLFLENPYLTKQLMVELDTMGVELLIDDFGTGYSSLSHLEKLPISTVKIDRSFLEGFDNQETREVVRKIIFLAHKLGMRTTAKGIEREDQLIRLRGMGCNFGQGYLISRELEPQAVEKLLLNPLQSIPNHNGWRIPMVGA